MTTFQQLFGRPAAVRAEAPGRVNLIGEHTDYNGGFVLPTPIPQRCRCELRPREDGCVRAFSTGVTEQMVEYQLGSESPGCGWLDYLQGCTHLLRADGHALGGFDVLITSEIPLGSGLSSSAALDVCVLRALRTAFQLTLEDRLLAPLAQRVENRFVGAQVGIMDPLAVSLGQAGMALFIDTRDLTWQHVPLPAEAQLVVINSGIRHQHAGGDYNTRRAECEAACRHLHVPLLRDCADLERIARLPAPLDRRARHVVTENERVLQAVVALQAGDVSRLGELFNSSHDSQRDDYQVSIPEIDLLIDIARGEADVHGARLTGGGFGGSAVLLVRRGAEVEVAERVTAAWSARTGHQGTVLVPPRSP
jgi:galactokinase